MSQVKKNTTEDDQAVASLNYSRNFNLSPIQTTLIRRLSSSKKHERNHSGCNTHRSTLNQNRCRLSLDRPQFLPMAYVPEAPPHLIDSTEQLSSQYQEHIESEKIVSLAKSCLQIQNSLRLEEARSIENTLTFLLQNAEFESLSSKERATILTRKVCAIREDYSQMQ